MSFKITELEGFSKYLFYSDGRIFNKIEKRFMAKTINARNGYVYVNLTSDICPHKSYREHILICKAFHGDKPNHNSIVGHHNNIKTDNRIENLYWTTTKENSRKSWEDGCSYNKKGEDNPNSMKIKVLDSKTNEIVGVYGSIRECAKCVENTDEQFIQKVYMKGDYKTRTKKYKYLLCSESEFSDNSDLKTVLLTENEKADKRPSIFKATFEDGREEIWDNQKAFGRKYLINQAIISNAIKNKKTVKGMTFERVSKIDYTEASSYENFLETVESIIVENIFTHERITFDTANDLKKHFDLKGRDIRGVYSAKDHLIHSEWRIIN